MNNDKRPLPDGQRLIEEEHIPVVEERVVIGKREHVGRTVSVTTRPVAEEVTIREPTVRETVSVERVPVGSVVDQIPKVRQDGDLTVIPVVEERARLVKELVLVEEIHLRRHREESVHEETVTTVRTEVDVNEGEQQ